VIGGNGGHFWNQHPKKHKVYQKYSMQLKKKYFCRPVLFNMLKIFLKLETLYKEQNKKLLLVSVQ
jgi:hypothetical protein